MSNHNKPQKTSTQPQHPYKSFFISRPSPTVRHYWVRAAENATPLGHFFMAPDGLSGTATCAKGNVTAIKLSMPHAGPTSSIHATYGNTATAIGTFSRKGICYAANTVAWWDVTLADSLTIARGSETHRATHARQQGYEQCIRMPARNPGNGAHIEYRLTAPSPVQIDFDPDLGNHFALFVLWLAEYTYLVANGTISL